MRKVLYALTIVALLLGRAIWAQQSGGAFIPSFAYDITAAWRYTVASPFVFEGATDDAYETTLTVTDPTADRTITVPNTTGTMVTAASALKIETGQATLDGANPTRVTTTIAITNCVVTNQRSTAPEDDPTSFTVLATAGGTTLDIHAWKNSSGTDPTQLASTDNDDVIAYICVGT